MNNQTIYATFADRDHAKQAIGALLDHGARAEDLSVLSREPFEYITDDPDGDERTESVVDSASSGISTTTGADAAEGAMKGAGIGLGVGVLATLASLMIPGVGFVLGGGALATALAGAAAATGAGAVAGGAYGYLRDQGVPSEAVDTYQNSLEQGGVLIGVSMPSGTLTYDELTVVLDKYNASNRHGYEGAALRAPDAAAHRVL